MPKWSHWLDDEYLENEPPKTQERIKRGQRQVEDIKGASETPTGSTRHERLKWRVPSYLSVGDLSFLELHMIKLKTILDELRKSVSESTPTPKAIKPTTTSAKDAGVAADNTVRPIDVVKKNNGK